MPRGKNNDKTRKMRRLFERQQKKGNVSEENVQEFEKSVEDRNRYIEQKREQDKADKQYEDVKQNLNKEIQNIKNVKLDVGPVKTTSYVIMACAIQVMLTGLGFYMRTNFFGHVFGFLAVAVNLVTCLLMKSHSYNDKTKVEVDGTEKQVNRFSFTRIGGTVIILDRIVSSLIAIGTGALMTVTQGIYRPLIFVFMTLYRDYMVRDISYVIIDKKKYYIKDLTSSVVQTIYYLVSALNLPTFLFFVSMTFCYKDVRDILNERMRQKMEEMKAVAAEDTKESNETAKQK